MPSSYTAPLHDGKPQTFEQFALRCSRAMGAAIMQRDESLDVEIKLREMNDYEAKALANANTALAAAKSRTLDEWAELERTNRETVNAQRRESNARSQAIVDRYHAMAEQVQAWTPPTPEHEGLKQFMLDQLADSARFDGPIPSWGPIEPRTPEDYRNTEIEQLERARTRATEALAAEEARVAGQNAWVIALRDSLDAGAKA